MFKINAETFAKNYDYNIKDKEKNLWFRNKYSGKIRCSKDFWSGW